MSSSRGETAAPAGLLRAQRLYLQHASVPVVVKELEEAARELGYEAWTALPFQEVVASRVLEHPVAGAFPPSPRYTSRLVKLLVAEAEAAGSEVAEGLLRVRLAASSVAAGGAFRGSVGDAETCYESFWLPADAFPVCEGRRGQDSFITCRVVNRGNEVGLRLWPAAFFLAEFCLARPELFRGRRVLELGAGVGLTGLAVAACCGPREVVLTDHEPRVLANLRLNVENNRDCLREGGARFIGGDHGDGGHGGSVHGGSGCSVSRACTRPSCSSCCSASVTTTGTATAGSSYCSCGSGGGGGSGGSGGSGDSDGNWPRVMVRGLDWSDVRAAPPSVPAAGSGLRAPRAPPPPAAPTTSGPTRKTIEPTAAAATPALAPPLAAPSPSTAEPQPLPPPSPPSPPPPHAVPTAAEMTAAEEMATSADVILGADIVYDPLAAAALAGVLLRALLPRCGGGGMAGRLPRYQCGGGGGGGPAGDTARDRVGEETGTQQQRRRRWQQRDWEQHRDEQSLPVDTDGWGALAEPGISALPAAPVAILASTVRNQETFSAFLEELSAGGVKWRGVARLPSPTGAPGPSPSLPRAAAAPPPAAAPAAAAAAVAAAASDASSSAAAPAAAAAAAAAATPAVESLWHYHREGEIRLTLCTFAGPPA